MQGTQATNGKAADAFKASDSALESYNDSLVAYQKDVDKLDVLPAAMSNCSIPAPPLTCPAAILALQASMLDGMNRTHNEYGQALAPWVLRCEVADALRAMRLRLGLFKNVHALGLFKKTVHTLFMRVLNKLRVLRRAPRGSDNRLQHVRRGAPPEWWRGVALPS